jgi:hypothetical protein
MLQSKDRTILKELANQVAEIAALPLMGERRELWKRHNKLQGDRPMILVFPEGSWRELLPDTDLECQDSRSRQIEWNLRSRLYTHEHFLDDTVIENIWTVQKRITVSGWGMEIQRSARTQDTGSWHFIPVLQDFDQVKDLHFPELSYDPLGTQLDLELAQDLFDGILDVRLKGVAHISFHLAQLYSDLRGLEQTYTDMVDFPDEMLALLEFLTQGLERLVQQYIDLNLLSLNNDDTYHSSGGVGYSDELPAPGFDPDHVRPADMWASAESQEYAVVSPRMHRKFALNFEKRLLAPFGLTGYGCCEDLGDKLDDVLTIPNIRRISISPFADVKICAEKLGNKAIFSWKPQPQHLVGDFQPEIIRDYIQRTLQVANDCTLEMILKDTHTCENHPERFDEWTRIARQLVS